MTEHRAKWAYHQPGPSVEQWERETEEFRRNLIEVAKVAARYDAEAQGVTVVHWHEPLVMHETIGFPFVEPDGTTVDLPPRVLIRVPADVLVDQPEVQTVAGYRVDHITGETSVLDPETGTWIPAEPLGMIGWKAKAEERLRRRGWTRLANLLARWDERGLG